ncbi:MAG: hypothetical protein LT102_15035 [Burkholderiaceae bacterium]|nr:hypothetical protein [Burkholderiaceae bacterium]
MFVDFCAALESRGIRYVILAGHDFYPDRIDSDVDFMVSEADFERLPRLFASEGFIPGARLIHTSQHETTACCFVFTQQIGSRLAFLHADASASYRRRGRLWMRSETVLSSRRRSPGGFWIPAPAVEFEYYLVKRLDKGRLELPQLKVLAARFVEEAPACKAVLANILPPPLADSTAHAIARRDARWFANHTRELRQAILRSMSKEGLARRSIARVGELRRKWLRVMQPTGFVIAVLGPDGSGKTTVIEHLEHELAPVFRRARRFHLRPRFGTAPGTTTCAKPHGQPPRSWAASALKVLLFASDYWTGWLGIVLAARVRSTLLIFDRYYQDMLVDPVRYRLPPRFGLARSFAPSIPKPDMWLVLRTSPTALIARKQELDPMAAEDLVERYSNLTAELAGAFEISTDGALESSLERAVTTVRTELERRVFVRIGVAR